jgi:hypothetical protein
MVRSSLQFGNVLCADSPYARQMIGGSRWTRMREKISIATVRAQRRPPLSAGYVERRLFANRERCRRLAYKRRLTKATEGWCRTPTVYSVARRC